MYLFFPVTIAEASAYYAFQNSDGVGKFIVILLFIGSILTWTIMIEKGLSLYRAKKSSEQFINLFRGGKAVIGYVRDADRCQGPVARIYECGAEKMLNFYDVPPEQVVTGRTAPDAQFTEAQMEAVRTVLEREVSDQVLHLEEKIGMLATAVSVSPFFGLFGTVWGVMMAFCGVAAHGKADISALAPGVSGALLTTVVGLLVAIPSLIGYNLLTITIRKITVYMDNFVEEFLARIKLEQLD